ncbi:MAG: NifB/NifX family molybdenum-iron cluster-binding protein [Prolixibacteraceae bacterium]|nr:NifB/NifX family molybdenum-iron cluster-binding protein [Prolixibacteraceae bacterium]
MEYLVASSGDTLDSKVSGRFGHSNYFLVIEPNTMEFEVFPGVSKEESQHLGRYMRKGIEKFITGNIGPSAFTEVMTAGGKVYLCRNMPVVEAVKKVKNGDIQPLQEPTLNDSIHSARKEGYGRRGMGGGGRRMDGGGRGMGGGEGRGWGR